MPDPCKDKFDEWKQEYKEWQAADKAADKAFKNSMVSTGAAGAICAGTWWTGVGLLGCAVTGALALNSDYDSIDASEARDDASRESNAAGDAYQKCVEDHKQYYKQ
jgi:hypothetical protein